MSTIVNLFQLVELLSAGICVLFLLVKTVVFLGMLTVHLSLKLLSVSAQGRNKWP